MAEQVVAEYKLDVKDAVKNLDKLQQETKQLDKDLDKAGKDGSKSLDKVAKSADSTESRFGKLKLAVVTAFAALSAAAIAFGKEAVQVAAKAEGIERAFNKLNRPNLLAELRRATRGTVSDLDLMQKAVQANNFQLPLEKLATLFKFATDRAIETGESVDYLVESIVLGISRKSIPIMDNLGISSVALQEEMRKTGDFAEAAFNIVEQSMREAGEVADTTAVKLAKLNTIWDNFLVDAGDALINLGTGFAFLLGQLESLDVQMTANEKAAKNLAASFGDDLNGVVDEMVKKNQELLASQLKIAELEETRSYQNSREAINNINDRIKAEEARQEFLRLYITELKNIFDASKQVTEAEKEEIRNIFFLTNEIKKLKEERQAEATTRERILDINKELIPLEEELNFLLGKQIEELEQLNVELEQIDVKGIENFTDAVNKAREALKKAREEAQTKSLQLTGDEFIDPNLGFPNASSIINTQSDQETFDESLAQWNSYASSVAAIGDSISQIQAAFNQQELDALNYQLQQGEITRDEYDQRRRQIMEQQAEDRKAAAIFDATVTGFSAVVQAYNTDPTGILAGITAAVVAAQIAAIAATPVPQYAKGVIDLKGAGTETSDSIHAKLSRGESVMTAKETRKYKEELLAIRRGNFEDLIITKYVKPMINESLFKGFADLSKSAQLNGITANLKDHNILHGLDRLRQSQQQGFMYLAEEQRKIFKKQSRGGYRA